MDEKDLQFVSWLEKEIASGSDSLHELFYVDILQDVLSTFKSIKLEYLNSKMHKRIVSVDFDGTLVFNEYPRIENPNVELINFIKEHKDDFVWILNTARHGDELESAVEYLKRRWDLEFDCVNTNVPWLIDMYGDCRKIVADFYLDDRNLHIDNFNDLLTHYES